MGGSIAFWERAFVRTLFLAIIYNLHLKNELSVVLFGILPNWNRTNENERPAFYILLLVLILAVLVQFLP
jgi:hypothetical protein